MPGEKLKYYHLLATLFTMLVFWARLTDVGSNPAGFYCDEAAIAFNARSILETGKDEHGRSFPLYFKSYGDYKSALYIYSVAVAQKIFGNQTSEEIHFTTRLPAAIFLGLTLLIVYLILARTVHPACGLLALPLLATEPWLHHFSHIGFSLTAIPFLLSCALYFWIEGTKGNQSTDFCLSAFFFSTAFYTYAPARVFVPLSAIALLICYRRTVPLRQYLIFTGTALICALPFLSYLFFEKDFLVRVNYLSVFTTPYLASSAGYKWWEKALVHNGFSIRSIEPINSLLVFLWNYCKQLSPSFLFYDSGPNLKFGPGDSGIIQSLTAIGLIAGLVGAVSKRNPLDRTLLFWILIFPLPVALTWEDIPHAGRAIVAHPALNILATIGLWNIWILIWKRKTPWLRHLTLCVFIVGGITLYSVSTWERIRFYTSEYSVRSSAWMQYGMREIVNYIKDVAGQYREIDFITTGLLYEPEMQILMYSNYPAAKWQATKKLPYNVKVVRKNIKPDYLKPRTLYIFSPPPSHIPSTAEVLKNVFWEDNIGQSAVILRLKTHQ